MKKNLKKIMAVGLAAALSVSVLAGCGGSTGSSSSSGAAQTGAAEADGAVTIKFVHKFPEERRLAFFEQIVAEFEEANPNIHIEMTCYGDEEIKDKIRVLLGSADSAPDIYFTWSGERIMQYVNSGNTMDISSYFEADQEWTDSFNATILSTCNKDGSYWAVPWDYSSKEMVYNKAIFAELGLEIPTTWDAFLDVCQKIKDAGYIPLSVGNQYSWVICHYITSLNGKLVDPAVVASNYNMETLDYTDPGYAQAFDLLKELYDLGYINSDVNSCTWETSQAMVQEGKAAMIYEEVQDFVNYDEALGDDFGYFDLPEVDGNGEAGYITGGPDVFMVNSDCAHPDEAMLFLKWLTSDSVQSRMCYELGFMPVTDAELDENQCLAETLEVIKKNLSAPGISEWLDCVLNQTVADTYLVGCQTIFDGETGESIMASVSATANEVAND